MGIVRRHMPEETQMQCSRIIGNRLRFIDT